MTLHALPLGPLERALLDSLRRLEPQADEAVLACAALCCEALAGGDVCLPLARVAGRRPWPEFDFALPALGELRARLQGSALVAGPGAFAPLILEGQRLYLARYQAYEQQLAERLLTRAADRPEVDEAALSASLARLFAFNQQQPDWQRLAAAQAVRRRLAVISGGPGTGKTTTVVRLLAALLEQPGGDRLAIGLAAPTGKAAARMAEAIRNAKADLPLADPLKALLPEEARTLHRLLGSRGDSPAVRHDAARPLALDVLVVDEASMVDLALMAKLVDGLPPQARLILLGDKDQLAAVEAGAVFAELCEGRGFDAAAAAELRRITGQDVPVEAPRSALGDAVVLLSHSHRFAADSGIGELARRINAGDATGTLDLLREGRADLSWRAEPEQAALLDRLEQGYRPYLQAARQGDPAEAFAAFNAFRALTAQREGPWGVSGLNEALEARIKRRWSLPERERWYPGRAVMVRQNDYALGLFNGDIGICLASEYGLRVHFESEDGFRAFAPARLPSHDSAFAMTVHKSQGSEFAEVLLVLPEGPSPLLTRALFYTGITRAKRKVEILGLPARLCDAVNTRAERAAGLAERLGVSAAEPERSVETPMAGPPGQLDLF
ncbi:MULTISPECIES: exodeoxyribonuclease V subunit alpha [unclassified Pseudomonas]|uniref:exodeoxyribonuclease V subunit alpha n=1 Tax=unclassified Pseudomonas TaxID=196821 RepID=UPI0024476316|nr:MULTISPECIES: exodeoxyribonuclease V subunit alpha [unclassified Pseudomonas]MDG9930176.1 exodeoxyribonuclease V subunit alpha [Pseudomonas sp. GD04042]MDH0485924.1 exodeoxyribonuclease V subunit alpha [Pseudomonas sp. GD04015]MDH0606788.1 exodeoxyribonuclease V subunit alpha [Pseudomonas sp. GD03869]